MDATNSYRQIAEALRDEIRAGVYAKHGSFPSLTKIMRRFGVSRPSAVRSVEELKRLGLVTARRGLGTFISGQNRTIGLAIPGTADSEFFAAIMDGLVFNCNQHGMDLVAGDVFPVNHRLRDRQAERLARHLVSMPAAGVIMQPVAFSSGARRVNGIIADVLGKAGIPVVLIDYDIVQSPARSGYDLVAIDNFNAGRRIAAHLLDVGAKRICCLLCGPSAESVHTRFAGVDAEVFRTCKGRHVDIIMAKADDARAISAGLKRFRPDAIVCSNDVAAATLAKTLEKLGVSIPDGIMLAGFDDVRLAGSMKPGLTTIHQPCFEIATTAFRTLLERMKDPRLPPRQILLNAPLVVRGSTGRGPSA